jgi:hypothetical protein
VNLSGVVEILATINGSTFGCTGSLLSDGYSILTAGHCVLTSGGTAAAANVTVSFQGPSGMVVETVSGVKVDPAYSVGNSQNGGDLAVLTLSQAAPSFAAEYSLDTSSAPLNTAVVIAGYGLEGDGTSGATSNTFGTLRAGENEYLGNGNTFFRYSSSLLVGEFYEASVATTNALECSPHRYDSNGCTNATPFTAVDEVDIASGDSGGPTFYNGQIVGVHDLGICLTDTNGNCSEPPSVSATNDSFFGQAFADTGVASNLAFIQGAEVQAPEPATLGLSFGALLFFMRRRRG